MAASTCDRCGGSLPGEARFCPRCGAPVQLPSEERKVVTVLFVDLAGSTELAAELDPERYREVMGAFYRMASDEVVSLRGRVDRFAGDAVLAVFGLPHAHDDDALRAVRAGLMIRDRTGRLGDALGLPVPLRVRVGIDSGPVATGGGPGDQGLVLGATVNLAARLEQAAEPGEVLVGATTWQLTRHAVDYGPERRVTAKGFAEAVRTWPVAGLAAGSSRRTIPLVGRKRELGLLGDTVERVREGSRAHLVTLLGEAGIGKSRLVDELVAGLPEDVTVLSGRADEFDEDAAFAPIAEMLHRALGVGPEARPEDVRGRLEVVVRGCCDPSEVERGAARLGLALGVGQEDRERRYRGAEIRSGLVSYVEGLPRSGPVVLVFEDLHLGRPVLLDLVEGLVRQARRIPLLVLCAAREELLEVRPAWGAASPMR